MAFMSRSGSFLVYVTHKLPLTGLCNYIFFRTNTGQAAQSNVDDWITPFSNICWRCFFSLLSQTWMVFIGDYVLPVFSCLCQFYALYGGNRSTVTDVIDKFHQYLEVSCIAVDKTYSRILHIWRPSPKYPSIFICILLTIIETNVRRAWRNQRGNQNP
jgi:hypothetical protein